MKKRDMTFQTKLSNEGKSSTLSSKKPSLHSFGSRSMGKFYGVSYLLPYAVLFLIFIVVPVVMAIVLSFTNFNTIQKPEFIAGKNYLNLFTSDPIFMQYVLPNTLTYAFIVGPVGYMMSFFLAWSLAQIPKRSRTILALLIYSPSMTGGVAMTVVWRTIFASDRTGIMNSILLRLNIIHEPIHFLADSRYILGIMILVGLWSSAGVGFLAMLAGVLNVDQEQYEAAAIDGVRNRFQEMIYITIPNMKPQMLFGAIMAVVTTFQNSAIGVQLTGSNPTPNYAGQLMVNHIEDYGFLRYEMGYAAAVSVILLLLIFFISNFAKKLFADNT